MVSSEMSRPPLHTSAQADQRKSRSFRQFVLFFIEREESTRPDLDGNGHMEQIHAPNQHPERVFRGQLAGGPYRVDPVKLDVRPVADPHLLRSRISWRDSPAAMNAALSA